ncbi:MAG: hypothetical protein J07HB67_02165 [halophilic archaeon J07HB67]|nr:MAG: hypothetical protein J07HB67_02165 [halophilic archaeon J07HB67]
MIVAYLESAAAASRTFAERLREQLSTLGIDEPTTDGWYPAAAFQTALFETADSLDEETLRRIGRQMAASSAVSDETDGAVAALAALDTAHDHTHRNWETHTTYELRDVDERTGVAVVACPTMPYPETVTRGAVAGVVTPHADRVDVDTLPPGDDQFRFRVRWE